MRTHDESTAQDTFRARQETLLALRRRFQEERNAIDNAVDRAEGDARTVLAGQVIGLTTAISLISDEFNALMLEWANS